MKLKKGDRVKCLKNYMSWRTQNQIAEIIDVVKVNNYDDDYEYTLVFENNVNGWGDVQKKINCGHGLYVRKHGYELQEFFEFLEPKEEKEEEKEMGMSEAEMREKAENIIKYYNKLSGTQYKMTDQNVSRVLDAVDVTNRQLLTELRIFIDRNAKRITGGINELMNEFEKYKYEEEKKKEEEIKNSNSEAQASLTILEQALAKLFLDSQGKFIEKEFVNKCVEIAKEKIKEEYGTIEKKVKVTVEKDDEETSTSFDGEILHEKFDEVLKFVSQNEPVFLTGEAGTGKNVICKQVAKALGLDFYFSNAVTQEYKITGFTDAMGNYQETQFFKAFKNGGLFMLDEMDASIPEVLVILNSAIANKYFDFPAPIGYVEAHPDFRVVSAGNTFGEGASYQYVGRNQLDGASLDRFACVNVSYDRNIEMHCAENDEQLVEFVDKVREICKRKNIQIIVSYRSINRIHKMEKLLGLPETLKSCLFKSLNKKEINNIITEYGKDDKFKDAMIEMKKLLAKGDE